MFPLVSDVNVVLARRHRNVGVDRGTSLVALLDNVSFAWTIDIDVEVLYNTTEYEK